jgi:hypothetical protein
MDFSLTPADRMLRAARTPQAARTRCVVAPCWPDCSTRYVHAPFGKPANRMSWTIWSRNNPDDRAQPA